MNRARRDFKVDRSVHDLQCDLYDSTTCSLATDYTDITEYYATLCANTLNVHVEQRWDVWGHFRVITTIRHFPHNALLHLLFIY